MDDCRLQRDVMHIRSSTYIYVGISKFQAIVKSPVALSVGSMRPIRKRI